jgi:hypothetical protein
MLRSGQNIEAEIAVMHLSDDEKRIQTVELHDRTRITSSKVSPGGLQAMSGGQMNLSYGRTASRSSTRSSRAMPRFKSQAKRASRAGRLWPRPSTSPRGGRRDTDGAARARERLLTFPPEPGAAGRTIRAANLDAKGEEGKGLTRALFTGGVQYREHGTDVDRAVNSGTLDVGLKPAMSSIDDAKFAQSVKFEEGKMAAQAAAGHYDIDKGLSRSAARNRDADAARRERADRG